MITNQVNQLLLLIFLAIFGAIASGKNVYVSTKTGSDKSIDGSETNPFKTLRHTVSHIWTLRNKQSVQDTINVFVGSGTYNIYNEAINDIYEHKSLLYLCGSSNDKTNWIGVGDQVIFNGAVSIDIKDLRRDEERTNQYLYDLNGDIFDKLGLGEMQTQGLGGCNNVKSEIAVNGVRLELARYPNLENTADPVYKWLHIDEVIGTSNNMFTFPRKDWAEYANIAEGVDWGEGDHDLWLHGYFHGPENEWADNFVKVQWINMQSRTVKISDTTPPLYGLSANARNSRILYLYFDEDDYKTAANNNHTIELSIIDYGISVCSRKNIKFENIKLINFRESAIVMYKADHITMDNINVQNIAQHGLILQGDNLILNNSKIHNIGCIGMFEKGGDFSTLAESHNIIENNKITHCGKWQRTYSGGIKFQSVGSIYRSNFVAFGPHSGIHGAGNNNIFEHNTLDSLCRETGDCGAFYIGSSWTFRENKVRYNYFTNINRRDPAAYKYADITKPWTVKDVMAIYFDLFVSDQQVYGNTFEDCQVGVQINGGNNVRIYDNIFIGGKQVSYRMSHLGAFFSERCKYDTGILWKKLKDVNYKKAPYSTEYPTLLELTESNACKPMYNTIKDNIWCCDYLESDECVLTTDKWDADTLNEWQTVKQNNTALLATDAQCLARTH